MIINRKDIGYTLYSRLEESIRLWLVNKLYEISGNNWRDEIPEGVWNKALEKLGLQEKNDIDEPLMLFEETDFPDLMDTICYNKNYEHYIDSISLKQDKFRELFIKLYDLRIKIAHIKSSFSAFDLDLLFDISEIMSKSILNEYTELVEVLNCLKTNPETVLIRIPENFFISDTTLTNLPLNNLPVNDYDPDGGFIGRKEDLKKINKLLLGNLYRVITISGAGGVGKSALAHYYCQQLISGMEFPFDALIWVSAKEEKLTLTGIEPLESTLRNYEDILNSILETYGWEDDKNKLIEEKTQLVDLILTCGNKGILLVIDNLETIRDERIKEFIKLIPPPNKVLITSRKGLGEVEIRHQLNEMTIKDAIILLRTVAKEKNAITFSRLTDDVLAHYVDKMSKYPLAIKWVVGQVATGKDLNTVLSNLTSPTGDVAKFCFEHIFESLLNENERIVLYSLAYYDEPLVRGVLTHLTNLNVEILDDAIRELNIASLILPKQEVNEGVIETKYELLPLTRNYIQAKLRAKSEILSTIKARSGMIKNLLEEADKAGIQYKYSLQSMGATSESEKVAATWAIIAFQKYQSGDYEGATNDFKKATEIAPNFTSVYRNWASMESMAGYSDKANELMKKATEINPTDSFLWFTWGNLEKQKQRFNNAADYLNKALKYSPDDIYILGALGEVEKRRGNYEKADQLLRSAISLAKNESNNLNRKKHEVICLTSLADNNRRWAELLSKEKFYSESIYKIRFALECTRKAMKLSEGDSIAEETYMEVSLALALELKHKPDRNTETAKAFENAIKENPKGAKQKRIITKSCYFYSKYLFEIGKKEKAMKYYSIGRRNLLEGSPYSDKYKALSKLLQNLNSN